MEKIKVGLIILSLVLSIGLSSQNTIPTGYKTISITLGQQDLGYIDFNSDVQNVKNQSGWDIAVYNETHELGGKINDMGGVKAWRVYKDTSQFTSITLADTINPVSNDDKFHYFGAFDTIYTGNLNTYFNIGLGRFYLNSSYAVYGDKIYIIKKEDGSFGKLFLSSYKATGGASTRLFVFKYSNIDNTGTKYININKITPLSKHFHYLNLTTGTKSTDFEPLDYNKWDLMIKSSPMNILSNNTHNMIRYSQVSGLPVGYLEQGVVNTEIYTATGVPTSVSYDNTLNSSTPISIFYNQIGTSWYDASSQNAKKDVSFFMKNRNGNIYHIVFTNYNKNSNKLDIAYKKVGQYLSVKNNDLNSIDLFSYNKIIYLDFSSLHLNKKTSLELLNTKGEIIFNQEVDRKEKIDLSKFTSGIYFARLLINDNYYIKKMVIE